MVLIQLQRTRGVAQSQRRPLIGFPRVVREQCTATGDLSSQDDRLGPLGVRSLGTSQNRIRAFERLESSSGVILLEQHLGFLARTLPSLHERPRLRTCRTGPELPRMDFLPKPLPQYPRHLRSRRVEHGQ